VTHPVLALKTTFTAASAVPAGWKVLVQDAGVREVRGGRGKAGGVSELVADTTLHQPRRPVVIVGDVTGPVMWSVSGTTQLARCLARQHRLYNHDTASECLSHIQGLFKDYIYNVEGELR